MTSKMCCLRQHIRNEPTHQTFVELSLDDNVLKYFIRGPNLSESDVEEAFELLKADEVRHESGSLAVLHTQNGFAFLEALSDDVSVESLGRNFDGVSAHTGMKVRPSAKSNVPSALQLLPGQSFYIGKTTLSLVPEEHSNLPIHSSAQPDSNFESYNHQVSQINTPQRTARGSSTVMETPMPPRDHQSEAATPIIEQITEHSISRRKDSKKWPKSPLKREVMRTMREASELGCSILQAKPSKGGERMADAAINEHGRLKLQPKVKIEEGATDTTVAKPLGEDLVYLEDPETAGMGLRSNYSEESESASLNSRGHQEGELGSSSGSCVPKDLRRLSPSGAQVQPDEENNEGNDEETDEENGEKNGEENGEPDHSPILARLKRSPSPVERVQLKRRHRGSEQSPFLGESSGSSQQRDDDLDDAPVRKKAKIATVPHEAVNEESQDSRQDEVTFVQNEIPAPTDRPIAIDRIPSTYSSTDTEHRSNPLGQPNQRSSTPLAGSMHTNPTVCSDSRPHPTSRLPLESSFNSAISKLQTQLSHWNTVSASPSVSGEPNSKIRSTRSTAREEQTKSLSSDTGIRIVFASSSSAGDSKPFMKFLSSKGVKKAKSVHDCTVLCIGKELKKTSKIILAVLLGKDIVTDSWVIDSVKGNDLLSIVPYIARDPEKEAEWGISLEQAIYRGKKGLKILQDHTVHFTPLVRKELGKNGFDELKEIVKCAGAKSVSSTVPTKSPEGTPSAIVVATQDGAEIAELRSLGWRAYVKDIISLSVLRGQLDLESDEFLIQEGKKEKEGSKKRKR